MKRLVLLLLTGFALLYPAAAEAVSVTQIEIDADRPDREKRPLANEVIELRGPEQHAKFTYDIQSAETARKPNQKLLLHFRHSELLIAPSSLTVQIDGEAVQSIPLKENETAGELEVPLTGSALEKGRHEITVLFYGIVKEGVCVEQGTPANWLSIQIDSYLQLNRSEMMKKTLADYPEAFIGTGRYPAGIVIPQNASLETLDSAMKIGAFLSEWTEEKYPVQIMRESEVEKLEENIIAVGAAGEFTSAFMKDLLQQTALPSKRPLTIALETLENNGQQVDALLVIAKTPEQLAERIAVLTTPELFEQLSGKRMNINAVPAEKPIETGSRIKLSRFGMNNLTLDGGARESEQLFYYAPFSIDKEHQATLHLQIKRSAPEGTAETAAESLFSGPLELTVLVNEVPHSINLDQLAEPKDEMQTIQVPIEPSAIKENRMISLQFKSGGLLAKNPCVTTDRGRWIYIEADSYFTFPKAQKNGGVYSFAQFPSPFIDDSALIVLAEGVYDDSTLLYLYRKLYLSGYPLKWRLADGNALTAEELAEHHALFIGGPAVQPLLQAEKENLLVQYKGSKAQLTELGFMQETAQAVAWIQKSPFGKKQLAVIDWLSDRPKIDRQLADFLQLTDETATIAVKGGNQKLYTNAAQLAVASAQEEEADESPQAGISAAWLTGFGVLLLFAAGSVWYVIRQRKRKLPADETKE